MLRRVVTARADALLAAAALLFSSALSVAAPARAQYRVLHGHIGAGGGVRTGGGHGAIDSAGQPLVGIAAGPAHIVKGGFWYCAEISSTVEVAFAAFAAEVREDAVYLNWKASASAPFTGFHVYRSEAGEEELARITTDLVAAGDEARYRDEAVLGGRRYLYRIGALDAAGGEWHSPLLEVQLPPRPTTLYQNYPNPFNPATSIAFYLAEGDRTRLVIYDLRGARVRTLVDGALGAGRHVRIWDGTNDNGMLVASGVYYYRLQAGKDLITRKLVIIR